MKIPSDELQEATPDELKCVTYFFLTVVGLVILFVGFVTILVVRLTIG